jgi:helix-turn-helix protein
VYQPHCISSEVFLCHYDNAQIDISATTKVKLHKNNAPAMMLHICKKGERMDLKSYLESRNIGIKEFADMIDVSAASISNYIHWHRKPRLEIAQRIVKATKGKVTIEDLLAYWEAKKDYG